MERKSVVQIKLTAEGLVLEIITENKQISPAGPNANINFSELNANGRLNSELRAILKFSKLPNSLQDLASTAHDYFASKHLDRPLQPFSDQPLREYLSLLVKRFSKALDEVQSKVSSPVIV